MKRLTVFMCFALLVSGFAFSGLAFAAPAVPQLTVQLMDNEQPDVPMVTDAINKILSSKYGATVKFQHLTWTDWQQKYKLLLTSGEAVDILYAANWNDFATYARNGAYLQLDTLLPKAVPQLYKAIPQSSWDGVKVGGKIFAVPPLRYGYSGSQHVVYRADLAKQWGAAPVTDVATFIAFLDAAKKNAPNMIPAEEAGQGWVPTYMTYLLAKANPKNAWYVSFINQSNLFFFDYRNQKPDSVKLVYEFPEYKQFLQTMRGYAQKGYWAPDVLAEKSIPPELLEAGKTAAVAGAGENVDKLQELIQRVAKNNPTWQIGEMSWDKLRGWAIPSAAQQDLTTIPIQSKYPEKALQVTAAFLMDKDLQYLIDYGIKGTHYDISAKNEYVQLPAAKGYMQFGMAAWAWKNASLFLADGSVWGKEHDAYLKSYDAIAVPNNGFNLDTVPIDAELTACLQVEQQYGRPLWTGLVADIDAGEKTFEQQLQAAGIEKIRAEIKKQFAAYLKEIGK